MFVVICIKNKNSNIFRCFFRYVCLKKARLDGKTAKLTALCQMYLKMCVLKLLLVVFSLANCTAFIHPNAI